MATLSEGYFSTHGQSLTFEEEKSSSNDTCKATRSERGNLSGMTMDLEEIPAFEDARKKLLPLIKLDSWVKTTKELLHQGNIGVESVFFRPINRTCRVEFGFTVAILSEGYYHYVLNSYLSEWHISEATLVQLAQANLRKRLIDEGEKIWRKSATGIHFIQGLDALTASVILLTDVIEMLDVQDGDPVAIIPTSDLCIIGGSHNVKQLCIMGEVSLKLSKEEQFISTQPLRLEDKQWKLYEANKANDEHPLPRTPDEVKMLKRALKMQGKI